MRLLGRLLIGLLLLGLMLGVMLRGRWPRRQLPWLIAICFVPAVLHASLVAYGAFDEGVEVNWFGLYLGVALGSAFAAWWFLVRLAPRRPFMAALLVPGQALFQSLATGALERSVIALGAAVDPTATAAYVGVAVMLGASLLVLLPTREHFPRLPRAPAWWVALLRALEKR